MAERGYAVVTPQTPGRRQSSVLKVKSMTVLEVTWKLCFLAAGPQRRDTGGMHSPHPWFKSRAALHFN